MKNLNFKFTRDAMKSKIIDKIVLVFSLLLLMGTLSFAQSDPVTSTTTWQTFPMASQTGEFSVSFDAVANADSITGVTGVLMGDATSYNDVACVVSFDNAGHIVARNGGAYDADSTITYVVGISYHVRMKINIPAHTYSIYVTPDGGSEITLGADFAFRTQQAAVAELNGWALLQGTSKGDHTVSNMVFAQGEISSRTWQTFPMSTYNGLFTASYDAIANADSITGVTGVLMGEATGYNDVACVVSFDNTGHLVARNGGAYGADSSVAYTAGTSYHVRMEINVPTHTYNIYVTPEGGSEITLGTDFAFRTQQSSVAELNGWTILQATSKGTHSVSNMTFVEGVTSSRTWHTFPMTSQTGFFSASFDAVPHADSITGVTGVLMGEATGYNDVACVVSFDNTGHLVARNGGAYDADSSIAYTPWTSYHVRMDINVPTSTYSIYVTPEGGDEITLGTDFAFRTQQAGVAELNGWTILQATSKGTHSVSNMTFAEGVTSSRTWQTFSMTTQTGAFTASFDAVANADSITGVTGVLMGEATGYNDVACVVSFDNTGHLVARNGGAYDADSSIAYTAGTSYHVRMEINVPSHTYSIYVTPSGGDEIILGTDFAFRSQQSTVAELNGWAILQATDKGTHVVSNMTFTEGITSSRSWKTFPLETQTGAFTASFDVVPNADSITGVTGILNGEATGWSSVACLVSFANTGTITVRDGGSYQADSAVSYFAGTKYHIRMEISIPSHTYSVYVTPEGGDEIAIATNFAFRNEQSSVTELNGWAMVDGTDVGTHTVSNVTVTEGVTSSRSWKTFPLDAQTDAFTASFDVVPNADSITGVTGILNGEATGWSSVACLVSFANTGTITVRDGGSYQADSAVSYFAGTKYHIRMEISIPSHTYSVYVTPEGGDEIAIATNFAFRTEQASVTELNGWAMVDGTDVGTHTVSNVTVTEGVTSSRSWKTFPLDAQTNAFTASFDVVPNADSITGVTGILNGEATGWSSVACLVSFANTGTITVRDGGSYQADSAVSYFAGTKYHIRMEIDIPSHTYNVYVTPEGGDEIAIATGFSFRTEQASVTELNGWAMVDGTDVGTHTVSNVTVTEGITSSRSWKTFPLEAQTEAFIASFDVVPNADSITGVTGILNGEATGWSSVACLVSFANTGTITVRDGGAYQADSAVSYTAGTSYHIRMIINISSHTYSVYVTPDGGDEITIATDFAFRTEQASVTELNGWAMVDGTDVGTHTVSNMTITVISSVREKLTRSEDLISIYPNPVKTYFNVVVSPEASINNARINIYDLSGKQIKTVLINSNQTVVKRDGMRSGMYFYRVINNNQLVSNGKLMVQ